jgi:hypothetical protein
VQLTGLESNQRTRDPKSRCPCQQSTGHREPSPGVEPGYLAIQRAGGCRPGGQGALGGSRTLTTSRPQTPQACASTSSATSAREPQRGFEPRTPPLRKACSDRLSYRGMLPVPPTVAASAGRESPAAAGGDARYAAGGGTPSGAAVNQAADIEVPNGTGVGWDARLRTWKTPGSGPGGSASSPTSHRVPAQGFEP